MQISAVPSVFGCIPSGSRSDNSRNEWVHTAGPPFLDITTIVVINNQAVKMIGHVYHSLYSKLAF